MSTQKNTVIIMSRNLVLGKVKSRLAKDIGEAKALNVYRYLQHHTAETVRDVDADIRVYYTDFIPEQDTFPDRSSRFLQCEGNLGDRMWYAVQEAFRDGYDRVCVLGTDVYTLQKTDVDHAFNVLEKTDVVLGPAEDGGYYLIGMNAPIETLFQEIEWSSEHVLQTSMDRIDGTHSVHLMRTQNDVDYLEDIRDQEWIEKFKLVMPDFPKNL